VEKSIQLQVDSGGMQPFPCRSSKRHPATPLADGFSAEVDTVDKARWEEVCGDFLDANIHQTWPYAIVRSGRANVSHLVLKEGVRVLGAVQVRLAGLPYLRLGMAYIRWGPLWKPRTGERDDEVFRQIVRAIRNEYAVRRGLVVRLLPALCIEENEQYGKIFEEEGYELNRSGHQDRTILMDVRPALEDLERGFHGKWRKHLNRARKNNLEIVEGEEDGLFEALGAIYKEMVQRKQFAGRSDITPYRRTQRDLAPAEKLKIILCKADGQVVAGALFSALGETAVDLFRATSNRGVKTYGSYLVQWRVLEHIKQRCCHWYNLNGINPARNPGGYQFKSQLAGKNGRDVYFLGPFDAYPNAALRLLTSVGERFRASVKGRRECRPSVATPHSSNRQREQNQHHRRSPR
jgi:FemAB family